MILIKIWSLDYRYFLLYDNKYEKSCFLPAVDNIFFDYAFLVAWMLLNTRSTQY